VLSLLGCCQTNPAQYTLLWTSIAVEGRHKTDFSDSQRSNGQGQPHNS
jgi:hypothetical protein